MDTASSSGSRPLLSNTIVNPKGKLKAITTRSGLVLDGPSVPMPPSFINPREDEHVEETLTEPDLAEYTIKKMLKALLSNKEKLLELANTPLNENCSAVILKKLPEKLGDPGKFLILCGFSETKCKTLADLVKDDIFDPEGDIVLIEKLLNLDSTKYLPPPYNINPLSGSTISSSPDHLLEEFIDKLALITFLPGNDDLPFYIESDIREIEYFLNHDPTKEMDYILEDSIDKDNLADPNDNLFDTIPEMFTDEHTLDYSSPPLYDDFNDDLFKFESPRSSDFLSSPEYHSFLFKDFSVVDALPSTNNEDKVFNPGILIHENIFEDTILVTPDKNVKKISSYNASLILKDFNPPLSDHELPFRKVLVYETLLSFSSENEEKVFNPRILTSKGVHTFLLLELSHRDPKAFKVIKNFESPMEIFPYSYGEDIHILDVSCLHFYPPRTT
uniref:Reverse transcriptase domain-containing protein n=1 Tax=Tanacetum cinerariifolium TaxID=118510 RepID=A0A6L2KYE3_TANCI|nr:reverse transcriptase domain-containing protein [Tanacetum cinerariifolium]